MGNSSYTQEFEAWRRGQRAFLMALDQADPFVLRLALDALDKCTEAEWLLDRVRMGLEYRNRE